MTFLVNHQYALGDTWGNWWLQRNGVAPPTSQPADYWARIDDDLGLPALQLTYRTADPYTEDATNQIRRNQITRPRASKGSATIYTPASGETAFWGFRLRMDPATVFGDSFMNMLAHTSFKASAQTGPTYFGKQNGTSQKIQVIYNRTPSIDFADKPTTFWLDVKMEYKTHPTAGYMNVWTKRHDEPGFSATPIISLTGLDSYGDATDLNQITWGIYEYTAYGKGDYPCNALQRFAVATTSAEIDSFLAPPVTVAGPPPPPHIDAAAGDGKVTITRGAVSGARTGDFWQLYRSTTADFAAWTNVSLTIPLSQTTYDDVGLTNGTTYYYRASAGNSAGGFGQWDATNTPSATPAAPSWAAVGTGATYALTAADVGHVMRFGVIAANAGGSSAEAFSADSAVVAAAPATPTNAGAPAISGTAQSGSALTGTMGTWNANGSAITSYAYQWQRETAAASGTYTNIAGASGTGSGGSVTYTAAAGDVGLRIRLSVTATNAAGTSTATVSAPTAAVTSAAASLVLARYALAFAGGTDRIILANAGSVGVEPLAIGALVYFTPGAARRYQAVALPADTSTPARALVVDTSTDRAGWDDQANGPRGQTGFPTSTWAWLCATRDVGGLIRAIFCNLSTGVWSALYQATSAGSITAAASAGNIVLGNAAQTTSGTIAWIGRLLVAFKANAYYTQAQMQAPVVSSGGTFYVDPAALLAAPSVEHVWRADNPSQPIQDSKGTAHELATGGRVGTSVYDAGSAILPLKVS